MTEWRALPDDPKTLPPGWYSILYCWEPGEGTFPGAAYWNGSKWSDRLPIVEVSSGAFCDEAAARKWADENDPEC